MNNNNYHYPQLSLARMNGRDTTRKHEWDWMTDGLFYGVVGILAAIVFAGLLDSLQPVPTPEPDNTPSEFLQHFDQVEVIVNPTIQLDGEQYGPYLY